VDAWKQKGPVLRFGHWLEETGMLNPAERARIEAGIEEELAAAIAFAEAGTWEPVEDLARDLYTEQPA